MFMTAFVDRTPKPLRLFYESRWSEVWRRDVSSWRSLDRISPQRWTHHHSQLNVFSENVYFLTNNKSWLSLNWAQVWTNDCAIQQTASSSCHSILCSNCWHKNRLTFIILAHTTQPSLRHKEVMLRFMKLRTTFERKFLSHTFWNSNHIECATDRYILIVSFSGFQL